MNEVSRSFWYCLQAVEPEQGPTDEAAAHDDPEGAQGDAHQREGAHRHEAHDEGRPEVGLGHDEPQRKGDEGARGDEVAQGPRPAALVAVHVARDREHQAQLHELAGLEEEAPELDPAVRPSDALAQQEHQHQRRDRPDVRAVRVSLVDLVVDGRDDHRHAAAEGEPVDLLDVKLSARSGLRAGGGVEVDHPERRDDAHHEEERPVEVVPEPMLYRARHKGFFGGLSAWAGGPARWPRWEWVRQGGCG
ncbi:MAG: hypothetical protein V9F06_00325 [Thermomicrobiales bacterium]